MGDVITTGMLFWPDTKDIVLPRDPAGRQPDAIAYILGLAAEPWKIGALGPLLRNSGEVAVPKKAEAETAAALHWLIGLVVKHGDEWGSAYTSEIAKMKALSPKEGSDGR